MLSYVLLSVLYYLYSEALGFRIPYNWKKIVLISSSGLGLLSCFFILDMYGNLWLKLICFTIFAAGFIKYVGIEQCKFWFNKALVIAKIKK
jgi:hypothetical protein